jgi:hypothetical protein
MRNRSIRVIFGSPLVIQNRLEGKFFVPYFIAKLKNVMWDCSFSGVSRSITQRGDLVRLYKGEACTHIKQITTKKVCTLHFIMFKNKYLGLCRHCNSCMRVHWRCLKAREHTSVYFGDNEYTFQCTNQCTSAA